MADLGLSHWEDVTMKQVSKLQQWWQNNAARRQAWPLDALGAFSYVPEGISSLGDDLSADLLSQPAEAAH